MGEIAGFIIISLATYGLLTIAYQLGKAGVRWTQAIDELIYQRKKRIK